GVSESYQINTSLVAGYYTQLKNMAAAMQIPETDWMQLIFRLPDVVKAADISIPDEEWKEVKDLIAASLKKVNEFRKAEGESLEKALNGHVETIRQRMEEVLPYEQARITRIREKLKKGLLETVNEENIETSRFEQ